MSENANRADAPQTEDRWASLWRRIAEHKLVQWTVAYIALAYGIQHGVTLTAEAFDWPHAVERVTMLLFVLGLPVAMTLAWYHGARASRRISGPELSIISILLVIGAGLFYVFARPSEEIAVGPASKTQADFVAGLSIAVLPFANLSGDAAQEFFSDGMTEEIAGVLAKVPDLHLVARSSAFEFKGRDKEARAVGQALGASHLIEGSVRKAGNRVRISAQLIRADNGLQLWTETYDRELTDIFATQEDIAQAIAGALRVPLGLKQGESLVRDRTKDFETYDQYLRARALYRARAAATGNSITEAIAILEPLVARDPDFAPAWALLADAYNTTPAFSPATFSGAAEEFRRVVDTSLPKAEAAAHRSIQLDANLADGYAGVAAVQLHQGKLLMAEDLYKQALALDPNNLEALDSYSQLLAEVGRLKEALAVNQHLQAVEPLLFAGNWKSAQILSLNGRNDAAIATLKAHPSAVNSFNLAQIYASQGRYGEAADALQDCFAKTPPGLLPAALGETAVRLLRAAPAAASPQNPLLRGELSWIYLYVGAPGRVLEFYKDTVDAGYMLTMITAYLWLPAYTPVRKVEGFKAFARNAGLVEYWKARGWPDLCHPVGADDFACN